MHHKKNKNIFGELTNYISRDEPIYIHCYCTKCDAKIILPEKVWIKRGSICNACYHRIHEED